MNVSVNPPKDLGSGDFIAERKKYKISESELERIKGLLGRPPKGVEWALFSALWSEHCSYKSSKVHLKKFFAQNQRVIQSSGENAGIVDLGEGEKIAFKIESHNHPSFIEPYQGAATGVGGIIRDILTMGARPIALANYLCFGDPKAERMEYLVNGVVKGIGDYGNCVGVPMVTGQTEFHSSYNKNILVNAMCVGYFGPKDPIVYAKAKGPGNLVVYVGAKTGRDGVHGASMASESFSTKDADKRPTVQVGDPFFEKLLIEACLEVIQKELAVAVQDMGAAGLTSSSFEMASRGGVGFDLHLDQVPLRDSRMTPEEILLSESQERMLLVCEPSKLKSIQDLCHKWGLDAVTIGQVRSDREMKLYWHGELLCAIDPDLLVENAPQYERSFKDLARSENTVLGDTELKPQEKSFLLSRLSAVENTSRSWIYRQYDQRVGTQTERDCSSPIGVVRLMSGRRLAVVLGGRPTVMRQDPYWAGLDSVAEPALQLAIRGFEPLAVTDCLNYGNPERERVMSEFVKSLEGMNDACRAFSTPIISGNVSFYNETETANVTSTPSTGLVGLRDGEGSLPLDTFNLSQEIYLARLEIKDLHRLANVVKGLRAVRSFNSVRLVSRQGITYTLARMCSAGVGAQVTLTDSDLNLTLGYQIIFGVNREQQNHFENDLTRVAINFKKIGSSGGSELRLENYFSISIAEIKSSYQEGWRKHFESLA